MPNNLQLPAAEVEIPFSILDTDLYKLTMQNAVIHHFPDAVVTIKFTNRTSDMLFDRPCFDWIQERIARLSSLRLQSEERKKLRDACPYFSEEYLDFLSNIKLHPDEQVKLTFVPNGSGGMGEIECEIKGIWKETILYEVPILAIFSEAYFRFVDTDWEMDRVQEKAKDKAIALLSPPSPTTPAAFSEFGTRRRRSFEVQDLVLRGLIEGYDEVKKQGSKHGALTGTSNVYLALKYSLKPIGTIAHEWIMAIGASYGYKGVNGRAMDMWEEVSNEIVYPAGQKSPPLTMLTDTFTVKTFFDDFTSDPTRAMRWGALRHDSGDPFEFVKMAKEAWTVVEDKAGVKRPSGKVAEGKMAVFSDSLDIDKALQIQAMCDEQGMAASFGIGTFLTNDFRKKSDPAKTSTPLNIVIKLNRINGKDCVKLSDDIGKYTGNVDEVKKIQQELGLPMEHTEKRRG